MSEFLITFRETLEAALIVSIIATTLIKQKKSQLLRSVRVAILCAIAGSIAVAYILSYVDTLITNPAYHALFEAFLMFLTAGILLSMVVRMTKGHYKVRKTGLQQKEQEPGCLSCAIGGQDNSIKKTSQKSIKATLIQATQTTLKTKSIHRGIFSLIFFAILREGFETVLFLKASTNMSGSFSHTGFRIGIISASALGYALYKRGKKIPIRRFFSITSACLIVFTAGMVTYGIHEVEEFLVKSNYREKASITRVRNILPPQKTLSDQKHKNLRTRNESKQTYYHIFHDKGTVGAIAKGLIGYNSDPNPIEPLARLFMIALGFHLWRGAQKS